MVTKRQVYEAKNNAKTLRIDGGLKMEILLWLTIYLAGVLPVSKAFMLELDRGKRQLISAGWCEPTKLSDVFILGLSWPFSVPVICFSELVFEPIMCPITDLLKKLV